MNFYGANFFPGVVMKDRTIKIIGIIQVFLIIILFFVNLYTFIKLRQKEAIIAVFTIHSAIGVSIYFVRSRVRKQQEVLTKTMTLLTWKDKRKLAHSDKLIAFTQMFFVGTFMVILLYCMILNLEETKRQMSRTFDLKIENSITAAVGMFFVNMLRLVFSYGQSFPGITMTTLASFIFENAANRLLKDVKSLFNERNEKIFLNKVIKLRENLHSYWEWKQMSDSNINFVPLFWLFFGIVSSTSFCTKLIVDWDSFRDQKIIMSMNGFMVVSSYVGIVCSFLLSNRCDRQFEEVFIKAAMLPKTCNFESLDDKVQKDIKLQLLLLNYEIKNRPDVRYSVYKIIKLDRSLLLSYMASTINFFVMVLQIRVSGKVS